MDDKRLISETAKEKMSHMYDRQNKHIAEHYDKVTVTLRKGIKERIKAETGESINGYINRLIAEDLEKRTSR